VTQQHILLQDDGTVERYDEALPALINLMLRPLAESEPENYARFQAQRGRGEVRLKLQTFIGAPGRLELYGVDVEGKETLLSTLSLDARRGLN
jgi:hypothetical protein